MTIDQSRLANITIELFQQGRRTVSYQDWLAKLDRVLDLRLANKLVEFLPDVVDRIEQAGYPCTAVNDYCVKHFAEVEITDITTAERCNVFHSAGKAAIAIRHALPG